MAVGPGRGVQPLLHPGQPGSGQRVLLEGDEPLKQARLALTDATRAALAAGLTLLGIATPENM
ncbi:DALR anticodon-binding domain-containing protein [Cystobacter fuscus]